MGKRDKRRKRKRFVRIDPVHVPSEPEDPAALDARIRSKYASCFVNFRGDPAKRVQIVPYGPTVRARTPEELEERVQAQLASEAKKDPEN